MIIQCKDVSKKFKNIEVLKNINIVLESGKIYGLYGRNGSGKSVFLKLLSGFYIPTEGKILYDGKDLNNELKYPNNLRALIETPCFFPDLTGYENLKLLAEITNKIGEKEINSALEIVNLLEEKDKKYSKYSLGMKQKLGIAQVIMEDPDIMILDEPFNGVEQKTVDKLIDYFCQKKKENKIIVICTHIKDDLEKLSDIVYYFDNGTISEK